MLFSCPALGAARVRLQARPLEGRLQDLDARVIHQLRVVAEQLETVRRLDQVEIALRVELQDVFVEQTGWTRALEVRHRGHAGRHCRREEVRRRDDALCTCCLGDPFHLARHRPVVRLVEVGLQCCVPSDFEFELLVRHHGPGDRVGRPGALQQLPCGEEARPDQPAARRRLAQFGRLVQAVAHRQDRRHAPGQVRRMDARTVQIDVVARRMRVHLEQPRHHGLVRRVDEGDAGVPATLLVRPHSDDATPLDDDVDAQYLSIRYTERLAAAGIERSVGSACDSYDNALAETVIGLYKRRRSSGGGGPGRGVDNVGSPPSRGLRGTTLTVCSSRLATCRRPSSSRPSVSTRGSPRWPGRAAAGRGGLQFGRVCGRNAVPGVARAACVAASR